jgi:hypothetical protein
VTQDGPTSPIWDASEVAEDRIRLLVGWLREHQGSFTRLALERSAASAGYTSDEFEVAWQRMVVGDPLRPGRRRLIIQAALLTIVAYGATWALFATDFLGPSLGYVPGIGLLQVLTVTLAVALLVSLAWTWSRRPNPEEAVQSMVVLLSLPLVLLVSIAGLCLPFTGMN